jgi:hypothetical protein
VNKHLGLLLGGTLAFWLLVVYPARALGDWPGVVYSAVAMVTCLVPTGVTLVWARRAALRSPSEQLLAVLGGTGLRMAVVLGIGLLLYLSSPYFEQQAFWIWLLVFYLFTLTWEMVLLIAARPTPGNP